MLKIPHAVDIFNIKNNNKTGTDRLLVNRTLRESLVFQQNPTVREIRANMVKELFF